MIEQVKNQMNQPIVFIMNTSDINYQEQCVYIWHSQEKKDMFNSSLKLGKIPVEGLVYS